MRAHRKFIQPILLITIFCTRRSSSSFAPSPSVSMSRKPNSPRLLVEFNMQFTKRINASNVSATCFKEGSFTANVNIADKPFHFFSLRLFECNFMFCINKHSLARSHSFALIRFMHADGVRFHRRRSVAPRKAHFHC